MACKATGRNKPTLLTQGRNNVKKKRVQITIELGNAAQKGRYERETHARYRPDEE